MYMARPTISVVAGELLHNAIRSTGNEEIDCIVMAEASGRDLCDLGKLARIRDTRRDAMAQKQLWLMKTLHFRRCAEEGGS